jgi:hypothetical protein
VKHQTFGDLHDPKFREAMASYEQVQAGVAVAVALGVLHYKTEGARGEFIVIEAEEILALIRERSQICILDPDKILNTGVGVPVGDTSRRWVPRGDYAQAAQLLGAQTIDIMRQVLVKNMSKKFTITSTCVQANTPTANGRVYPRAVLEQMVRRVNEVGPSRGLYGSFGLGPSDGKLRLAEYSHLVLGGRLDTTGCMSIDCEVLDTPQGRVLHDLLSSHQKLDILPRGIGSISTTSVVGDDYRLTTFDIVRKEDA